MEDDLLHGHDLLPALLDGVVVLPHDYLPVPGLLSPVEAVAAALSTHCTVGVDPFFGSQDLKK